MILDNLLDVFEKDAIHRIGLITTVTSQVLKTFEQEFANSKPSKNAAVKALIALLQKDLELNEAKELTATAA